MFEGSDEAMVGEYGRVPAAAELLLLGLVAALAALDELDLARSGDVQVVEEVRHVGQDELEVGQARVAQAGALLGRPVVLVVVAAADDDRVEVA